MTEKVWGRHPILEVLRANPQRVRRLSLASGVKGHTVGDMMKLAQMHHIPVEFHDRQALTALAGTQDHQGAVAELNSTIPTSDPLALVATAKERQEVPLLVLLDRIQDPQNVGAIVRTALAVGAHGVVLLKDHAAGFTPAAAKASAGASWHIPICVVTNLVATMELLKERGVWLVGADPSASQPHTAVDWKRPLGLVVGHEGMGLRRLVRERCDTLVKIPLKGPVGSLNASVAAGVLLFEIMRHR